MGMPIIPNQGEIALTTKQAINLILASIGSEELALAHILNAEGQKIQEAILKFKSGAIQVNELLDVNESVRKMIIATTKKEMLLEYKLENAIELLKKSHGHHCK